MNYICLRAPYLPTPPTSRSNSRHSSSTVLLLAHHSNVTAGGDKWGSHPVPAPPTASRPLHHAPRERTTPAPLEPEQGLTKHFLSAYLPDHASMQKPPRPKHWPTQLLNPSTQPGFLLSFLPLLLPQSSITLKKHTSSGREWEGGNAKFLLQSKINGN